jgi:hypothetical protein
MRFQRVARVARSADELSQPHYFTCSDDYASDEIEEEGTL